MFIYVIRPATKVVAALAIATAIVAIGGPNVAVAQDSAQDKTDDRIRECGAIEDATERMDCFDAVVEGLSEGSDVADASSSDVDAGPAATASGAAAVSEAAATTNTPSTAPSSAPGPSAAAGATATSAASEADDFGLEDQKAAEARQKEKEQTAKSGPVSVHATIVSSEKSGLNHFVVALDNGQVWEETDGSRRIGLPRIGTPVQVYEGKMGGYRMKFGGDNRIAWVRRLQ